MSKKRRKNGDDESRCIIHIESVGDTKYGNFIPLSEERFETLQEIREKRLAQPPDSVHRKTVMCNQIPSDFGDNLGYHSFCYKSFT